MSRTVRSPDGRSWTLERERPESALAAAKKEPVFWGSVILTVLMVGFVVWITIEFGVGILFTIMVILFVIWLLERGVRAAPASSTVLRPSRPSATSAWTNTPWWL